jgi:tetratricopeptide (TPR) repeat protein
MRPAYFQLIVFGLLFLSPQSVTAGGDVEKGIAAAKAGDYELAVSYYTAAIRKNPDNYYAYINRGLIYLQLDKADKSLPDFTEAIRLNPKSSAAYVGRGDAYFKLALDFLTGGKNGAEDNAGKAKLNYTQAIRLDHKNARAYWQRGLANALLRDVASAEADHREASRLDPKNYPQGKK